MTAPAHHDRPALARRLRAAGCVYADDEADVLLSSALDPLHLEGLVAARVAGTPLEQVVGWADFFGLRIDVDPGVFVPRRRSELLVRVALELAPPAPLVVDMCCGSGAIGAAIAAQRPATEVVAVDIDPVAVACAGRNLAPYGGVACLGDLYDALPPRLKGGVDLLVANAPYVPTEEIALMPVEARDYEPVLALDGGADGLDVARRVVAAAPDWLAPTGSLLVETSRRQAESLAAAVTAAGLRPAVITVEELEATVVVGAASPA
jgi:release factor glutamine methyltransferase